MDQTPPTTPLKYGALGPDFWLMSEQGETVTRHQFRNRAALVVVMAAPSDDLWQYLDNLLLYAAEFDELNVKLVMIAQADRDSLTKPATNYPVILLADPDRAAWDAYTDSAPDGAAVFVLDLYGGVYEQAVVPAVSRLPPVDKVLLWARGAQFQCNI